MTKTRKDNGDETKPEGQRLEVANGQAHKEPAEEHDESRRTFLKVAMTASALLAFGGIGTLLKSVTNPPPAAVSLTAFQRVRIANVADLQVNRPIFFSYPLDTESNILIRLGQKADGGVGPDGDIVAFSQICQHLGCPYAFIPVGGAPTCDPSYKAASPIGYCCCHGGVYDYLHGGKVIGGPPPNPVPQVILSVDTSGDIFAIGMAPPAIYGHNSGSDYKTSDLQGGSPVS